MDQFKITFGVKHPGHNLSLLVRLDDHTVWSQSQCYTGPVEISCNDDDGVHCLEIELAGKQPHHTRVDEQGSIIEDATISITDLAFDKIQLGYLMAQEMTYHHDFNGNGPVTQERFYGTLGCNGIVRLPFSTPFYLWLLEHM